MEPNTTPPPAQLPVDASQSEMTNAARTFLWQIVLVAGAIVAALGLPETSFLHRAVTFLKSAEAVPILGFAAGAIASGRLLWRSIKRQRERQTMALLLPNSVAKGPDNPSAAVAAAVQAATINRDQPEP